MTAGGPSWFYYASWPRFHFLTLVWNTHTEYHTFSIHLQTKQGVGTIWWTLPINGSILKANPCPHSHSPDTQLLTSPWFQDSEIYPRSPILEDYPYIFYFSISTTAELWHSLLCL
jgi:hypothetical protein